MESLPFCAGYNSSSLLAQASYYSVESSFDPLFEPIVPPPKTAHYNLKIYPKSVFGFILGSLFFKLWSSPGVSWSLLGPSEIVLDGLGPQKH